MAQAYNGRVPIETAPAMVDRVQAVAWTDAGVRLIDQRLLPAEERYLTCTTAAEVAQAIAAMVVRGAPAIGVTAAYGVVLAARAAYARHGGAWLQHIKDDLNTLARSRPTAVNLRWALARLEARFGALEGDPEPALLAEAQAIHAADIAANYTMGALGAALLGRGVRVLTHCNTGALATGGYGTALGVVKSGWALGVIESVFATETRPWLQGARLTAWELNHEGIPFELVADGAAAALMQRRGIDWVIVGADRIASNGDVANKIGTYALALAARAHGARVMVVAPVSTIDLATPTGAQIPVEDRASDELLSCGGARVAPPGVTGWNPVFDVTPAYLIDFIVTERGAISAPDRARLQAVLGG